jgi:hypothetical protein
VLTKLPTPLSSEVCVSEIVGFSVVPQHTPLAVTVAPPSFVITPPLMAEFIVIFVKAVVVNVGITGSFLQLSVIASPINKHIRTKGDIIFFILTIIN